MKNKMNTDIPQARGAITGDVALRLYSEYARNMANAARDLSRAVEARKKTISENEIAQVPEDENDSWRRRAQENIAKCQQIKHRTGLYAGSL